jgi:hypothetical protein
MILNQEYNDRTQASDGGMMINQNPDGSQHFDNKLKVRRNRRSHRLQKKNSLDVQFRRRFSMLRDVNAASNNIYNASMSNGFNNGGFTDLDASNLGGGMPSGGLAHDSRSSSLMPGMNGLGGMAGMGGPRASMSNISSKFIDKKFNKILINMQQNLPQTSGAAGGGAGVVSGNESAMEQAERWNALPNKHKKNRKRKTHEEVETHNV